jgi:putative FmdB family regulatory protein
MPLYEYRCEQCDNVFEVIQRFSDEPVAIHEGCGGRVERLLSLSALQFKGTGWYVTDYARAAQNGNSKDGATEKKGSSEKSDTSEAKTADGNSASTKPAESPKAKAESKPQS